MESKQTDILITGCSSQAQCHSHFFNKMNNINHVGYVVDDEYRVETDISGIPIYTKTEIKDKFHIRSIKIFNSSGFRDRCKHRQREYEYYTNQGYELLTSINHLIHRDCDQHFGTGCFTSMTCGIDPNVTVGNNTYIAEYAKIGHNTSIGNNCFIGPDALVCGNCHIGDNVTIGARCTIRNNISISDYAVLGMCTTIMRNVAAKSTVIGNYVR